MQRALTIALLTLLTLITSIAMAQSVKRRNGLIAVDGKPYLMYEVTKIGGTSIYTYRALGEEEVLFSAHYCNNWSYQGGDAYRHYYFPVENLELILPTKRRNLFKFVLPRMLAEGVLDDEGHMDSEALRRFVAKYHVPLPQRWGPRVHQLPVISSDRKETHQWKYSPDYDREKKEWKIPERKK